MNEHADKDRILGYHIFIHFQSNPMGHMEMMPGCSRHEEPHECEHRHGAFLERGIHVRAQIPPSPESQWVKSWRQPWSMDVNDRFVFRFFFV